MRVRTSACLCAAAVVALAACNHKKTAKKAHDARVRQAQCTITLASVPSGAAVLFEGRKRLGHTPLKLVRDVGHSASYELVKDGYSHTIRTIHFEGGPPRTVTVHMREARVELTVDTGLLRGVQVVIDGKNLGRTPKRVYLRAGKHVLTLSKSGHHPYREVIEIPRGDSKKRLVRVSLPPRNMMKKPAGWLSITTDAPALLYRGKKLFGSVPLIRRPMTAGIHHFTLKSSAIGVTKRIKVKVIKGELVKLKVNLLPPDAGPVGPARREPGVGK